METANDILKIAKSAFARGDIAAAVQAYQGLAAAFPEDKKVILQAAQGLRNCNQAQQAVAVLEAGLTRMPAGIALLKLLAETHLNMGTLDAAGSCLERIAALLPNQSASWVDLGMIRAKQGHWTEAEAAYARALQLAPSDIGALLGAGDALYQLGQSDAAVAAYRRAVAGNPVHAPALFKLGSLLVSMGEWEEAEKHLRRSTGLDPENAFAHINFGLALLHMGIFDQAIAAGRTAVTLGPDLAEAHHVLGTALLEAGHAEEAASCLRAATAIDPASVNFLLALAQAETALGRGEAAAGILRRVLALEPDNERAHALLTADHGSGTRDEITTLLKLAFAADQIQSYDEARTNYQTVLAQSPGQVFALSRLLTIDGIEGRLDDAETLHGLLVASLAHSNLQAVHWMHLAIIAYQSVIRPLPIWLYSALSRSIDRQISDEAKAFKIIRRDRPILARPGRRLKIGYLSSFFRDHPVGHVTAALFAAHDRSRFDVHVFYLPDGRPNSYTQQIINGAEHFLSLSGTESAIANAVAERSLDILIYLDGYMSLTLLPVMAMRPAPIQIFWLGHAGSCNLSCIDYVIGDATVVPPGEESLYTAKVARLPDGFHCASPHPVAPEMSRLQAGLPEEGFVFCAFNNPEKIDRTVFDSWMRILHRVDGSVLWLSRTLSPAIENNLREAAGARDIEGGRLIFAVRLPDKAVHLARHRLCDLFLDTFTLNASTTALDALWTGLPVLTVKGPRFSSRIATSFLRTIGLDDMVCASMAEYEQRAIFLATHPDELGDIRRRLAANRESRPLFQIEGFCKNLETCLEAIFENHPQ